MEPYLYHKMSMAEETHWWFVGRRRIVEWALKRMRLAVNATILEAGCGTGGNLELLGKYGHVSALESDPAALSLAVQKSNANIIQGSLPDQIPFDDDLFDLIVLLDVLEHLSDDGTTLERLRMRLNEWGQVLITVPAFPFLWSAHDEAHHHFRRYTRSGLRELLEQQGFQITFISHFNALLFPVVAVVRIFKRLFNIQQSDDISDLPPMLNYLLAKLLGGERHLMRCLPLPFGTSLLVTAKLNPAYNSTK